MPKKVSSPSNLAEKLGKSGPIKRKVEPVWKGPEVDGITYSLLTRFLSCRERFRLYVIEGLCPPDRFNHRIEYGHMWHTCEEFHARNESWKGGLFTYCKNLSHFYPEAREDIDKWYRVCSVQFPIYVDYWEKHPDMADRSPIEQEQIFCVDYKLPSGRVVKLRGKRDSMDVTDKYSRVWLQENKTKGDIQPDKMVRQLTFDLQTMMYLTAVYAGRYEPPLIEAIPKGATIAGVRYNVIRRPLSGGKGTIVQKKASKNHPGETTAQYYDRLAQYIKDEPETYFFRWNVEISQKDVDRFRAQCLDPILEQLCDWWQWVSFITERGGSVWDNDVSFGARPDQKNNGAHCSAIHWRHPFGSTNWIDEGNSTDLDEYLASGSLVGLRRVDSLFSELT